MLSSTLKLRRRLLVEMLLLKPRLVLPIRRLWPRPPGVLDTLDTLEGVPYVLYENPKPRFCGVTNREALAGLSLYIGRIDRLLTLFLLPLSGVASGPGFCVSLLPRPLNRDAEP